MRQQNKLILLISIVAIAAVIVMLSKKQDVDEPKEPAKVVNSSVESKKEGEGYENFESWPKEKLAEVVTQRAHQRDLPEVDRTFFSEQLTNKAIPEVVRNNMANGLINAEEADPYLHNKFIQMYNDAGESPIWRDYSIQFMSKALKNTEDKATVVKVLKKITEESKDNDGATAMLQLHHNHNKKIIDWNEGDYEKTVSRLNNPETFHTTKVVIIGIIRNRKDLDRLNDIRQCLKESQNTSVVRVAIAAIGVLGSEEDRSLIEKYKSHTDRSVKRAVQYALKQLNLKKKNTTSLIKESKGDIPA